MCRLHFSLLIVLSLMISCGQKNNRTQIAAKEQQSNLITTEMVIKPFIVNTDTMKPPEIIPIQDSDSKLTNDNQPLTLNNLFINYTIEKGLPVNSFTSSLIDSKGNLWLGSNGSGAVRFDGKKFDQFTTSNGLSNNGIWQMTEDDSGNIWFATYGGGLNRFDGKQFKYWQKTDGLSSDGIFCLGRLQQDIWLGTVESGVCKINTINLKVSEKIAGLKDKPVKYISIDSSKNVWIGNNDGVYFYDGKNLFHPDKNSGVPEGACTFILSEKNKVWFGIKNKGLICYDGNKYSLFTTNEGLSGMTISAMHRDHSGKIWMATDNGLTVNNNGYFSRIGFDEGLPRSTITSITSDHQGNVWLTTEGEGIFHYAGTEYQMADKEKSFGGFNIHTMCEDHNGTLWMGTIGGGVFHYKDGKLNRLTVKNGLVSNDIWSIAEDKYGNMWFGSLRSGVSRFDGKKFVNYSTAQGLSNDMIRSILCATDGSVWLGTTGGGVNHIKGNFIEQYHTSNGLCSEIILSVFEDHARNLWFGTVGEGVCKFDGKSFTTFNEKNGLNNNIVIAIHEDRHHNLWFATEGGGLSRHDGNSLLGFNSSNGLPDNTVYGIDEDKDGNIWIGSNKGLSKLVFREDNHTTTFSDNSLTNEQLKKLSLVPKNYTRQTGFPFKDMTSGQHAMLIDKSGIIWAGTAENKYGLIRIKENNQKTSFPSGVVIQSVSLDGKPVSWYQLLNESKRHKPSNSLERMIINEEITAFGRRLDSAERQKISIASQSIFFESISNDNPVPDKLSLPYDHNDVSFSFASIEPSHQQVIEYRYKMPGYADEWSLPSQTGTATFGNIHEGRYEFMVCSRFDQGRWGPVTKYCFVVRPPWYRSPMMYLLYFLALAGVVYGYSRWRLYRLMRANKMLELKVKQRTAEVVQEKENVENEKKKSDELLLNILPEETARELKLTGKSSPRKHEHVTIMFTDFKNFTKACEQMTPQEMVALINFCYSAFDQIISKNGLEKIKTIGDSYMCASGIPASNDDHAICCVRAALEIRDFMRNEKIKREAMNKDFFDIRIGLHSGSVVAGIVGTKKFAYDIWGDSVNIASRMESSGAAGMVNISKDTYELIKNHFNCIPRGKIEAKNKTALEMYFADWK